MFIDFSTGLPDGTPSANLVDLWRGVAYICIHTSIHIYIYMCMYMYIYIFIYIYI